LVDHKFDKLDELEKIIEKILTDTIDHINIEDNYLNTAVYKLIKEKDNNS
jgi:hemerythrin